MIIEAINLDNITNDFNDKLIVVTDWPCVSWYRVCMICVLANAVYVTQETCFTAKQQWNDLLGIQHQILNLKSFLIDKFWWLRSL